MKPNAFACCVAISLLIVEARVGLSADITVRPGPIGPAGVKRLSEHLEAVRAEHDLPAMGAAVVLDGKPLLVAAAGERKLGSGVSVQATDQFHLGSCTKAMTALLIERLVEQGYLRRDARIRDLSPRLAARMNAEYAELTLDHCLAHRGGFVSQDNTYEGIPKSSMSLKGERARFDYARRMLSRKPDSPVGTKFEYSNVGHTIAAVVAEERMKRSWERLMREFVFLPLDMSTAGYGAPGSASRIDQPWPHEVAGDVQKPVSPGPAADNAELIGPAARVHCSLADWSKFAAEIMRTGAESGGSQTPLLSPESRTRLLTPVFEGYAYAGGWVGSRSWLHGPNLSHDGTNTLNYAHAFLLPDRQFGVLVVTNSGSPAGKTACAAVRDRILGEWLYGGLTHGDLAWERQRAYRTFQWIAKVQSGLVERSRRYATPELFESLTSAEGKSLGETLKAAGRIQKLEFITRVDRGGSPYSVYHASLDNSVWRVEVEIDRKRIASRLTFEPISD